MKYLKKRVVLLNHDIPAEGHQMIIIDVTQKKKIMRLKL